MIKNSKKILNNKNRNKQATTKKKINKSWPDEAIRKTRWGGRHPNQLWKRPSSQALAANQWAARLHFRGTNRKSTFYLLAKSRISSMITEISQGGTFSELLYSTSAWLSTTIVQNRSCLSTPPMTANPELGRKEPSQKKSKYSSSDKGAAGLGGGTEQNWVSFFCNQSTFKEDILVRTLK